MSSVVVAGNTSGSVTLDAPAVSGSTVITLPTVSGTMVATDTSGNVGIGVTPSAWGGNFAVSQYKGGAIGSQNSNFLYAAQNGYYDGTNWKYISSNFVTLAEQSSGRHIWYNAPSGTAGNNITYTQAMTLDASGNLLVGSTSAAVSAGERVSITASSGNNGLGLAIGNFNKPAIAIYNGYTQTATATAIQFQDWLSTVRGSITVTTSGTAYVTTSDYRLKENIAPMTGALATVAQLKPVTYTWKGHGAEGQGFIAHELAEVVPDCVSGEKDAVDEEGKPVYQGIDTSFLVATLTAAIQEQQALITSLTARLDALENK